MSRSSGKQRLDNRLVKDGLAPSRQRAQALIMSGRVLVAGVPATKAARQVSPEETVSLKEKDHPYVSRGGLKLAHGLDFFSFDPKGHNCLDVGASTGGFTDCLLKRGAASVTAVDVGYGQLDWTLRIDPRVVVLERTNARYLTPEMVSGPFEAAVSDVSFISLTLILPPLLDLLRPGGWLAVLVKPQFEVGREKVGKGGVVRDPEDQAWAVDKITAFLEDRGVEVLGSVPSPIKGPKGNQEYVLGARK